MVTFESLQAGKDKIGVVGLGYVGLPLAVHLASHFDVVGFDLKADRIAELRRGYDRTLEVDPEELSAARITYSSDGDVLGQCRLIIVAVPTPIDEYNIPDFAPLRGASITVGRHLQKGSCTVFESTVFPGATEEICVPLIEEASGLVFGKDFTAGYSPERINPGDKVHTVESVVKIVSGSDEATADMLVEVYGRVVKAGIHRASCIKVAEAAKVIENTQRDLNIALMNELAMIFDIMKINTIEVLEAAGTKWNFLPFRPGLVGGHCIGVDPYYLTFKAESLGYHPEMILAGRRINDGMGAYVAQETVKKMIANGVQVKGAKVNVLGLTFKENCPDLRNSKVVDVIHELQSFGCDVHVHDPLGEAGEAEHEYGISLTAWDDLPECDAIVAAVSHSAYLDKSFAELTAKLKKGGAFTDVKSAYDPAAVQAAGFMLWRL